MGEPARKEAMQRKPILMPPDMIRKVDKIAKSKNASFAGVVREAVNAFDGETSSMDSDLRHMNERLVRLETIVEMAQAKPTLEMMMGVKR